MEGKEDDYKVPNLGRVHTSTGDFRAKAEVTTDGRANIHLHNFSVKATDLINKRMQKRPTFVYRLGEHLTANNKHYGDEFQFILGKYAGIPRINIAIFIVGSRGDVQPFIPIAQILSKDPYNHRVRICTHPVFKPFVEGNGLEFFSIGGDPATLMAYMVKNPGLMPGMESLRAGEVGKRRADIHEILEGCWRSCYEAGDGMGGEIKNSMTSEDSDKLFIAEAIIANPPSYAHIHCAEKLSIPLHMMFTMPWSPTQSFPHPLASFERQETDPSFANYISYTMMELLAWQGLGDVINKFRTSTLNLDPISPLWGHMLLSRLKVPFTYIWSSAIIPKPRDWGSHINITGFSFLSQASSYTPPDDLVEFLKAGPPPVYIGFGSIVVDRPEELTNVIFGAVKRAGVRALVSKGWGGLGGYKPPDGVFLLGNVPHDWLFAYVSAVVHHGGAGTTAIGIAMGKPTVIVPFFGDQPFWGAMVFKAGAGPQPIPFKKMTEETLANSITSALSPEIQEGVKKMSAQIAAENGSPEAAKSFQQAVNMDSMRCILSPDNVAVWRVKKTNIRLGLLAVATLLDEGELLPSQIKLVRHRDWYIDEGATDPIMGAVSVASSVATKSLSLVLDYKRSLSTSLRKQKATDYASSSDSPPTDTHDPNWDVPVRINPVQAALMYPPERLELLAQRLARKSYPDPDRSKRTTITRKLKSRPSFQRLRGRISTSEPSSSDVAVAKHGKSYEITHETEDLAVGLVVVGLTLPVNFLYNLANGFHNAPSFFWDDQTVRRRDKITGFGSGVKVAGKEFTLGLYDGFRGILLHPYSGVRRDGIPGLVTGIGKGAGGFVFKISAAAFGLPGYTLKGIEKQFQKRKNRALKTKIIAIRLRQSLTAFERASKEEKEDILKRWKELDAVLP